MKVTHELLQDLQEKARNATQGPWKVQTNAPLVVANNEQTFLVQCVHRWGKVDQAVTDVEYIAAVNPAVVLALIEKIERLEKEADCLAAWCMDACAYYLGDCEGCTFCEQVICPIEKGNSTNIADWREAARNVVKEQLE